MLDKNPFGYAPRSEEYEKAFHDIDEKRKKHKSNSEQEFEEDKSLISRGLNSIKGYFGTGLTALKEAPYKIVGAALLGLTIGITSGVLSYNNESYRDSKKHLGFSEISQIIDDVTKQHLVPGEGGKEVTGMSRTLYQAGLNDLAMKIIEDSNLAHEDKGDFYSCFSSRLRDRLDIRKKKHRHELNELFDMINDSSPKVKEQYSKLAQIRNSLPNISRLFNDSWTESHQDNYHNEIYLETVSHTSTDSNGRTTTYTTLEPRTRSVYDNTDHDYHYKKEKGEAASISLERLIQACGDIKISEPYYTAKKINGPNKEAIIKSRTEKEAPKLSENDFLGIVNTWYSGSTLVLNESQINRSWTDVIADSNSWDAAKLTAKDTHKITYSSRDSGPLEYQVAYKTRDRINSLNNILDESIKLLDLNDQNLPKLRTKINQFVQVSDDSERKRLGNEVLGLTQEIYSANFKNGFEVDRFRTGMIVLWSFLGTLAGAGAGFGLGSTMDRFKENGSFY